MRVIWHGAGAIRLNGHRRERGEVWTMSDLEYHETRRLLGEALEPAELTEEDRDGKKKG